MMDVDVKIVTRLFAAWSMGLAVVVIAGCSAGDVGVQPKIQSVDPIGTSKLQFAVGVATVNETSQGTVAHVLNTVETLRQPNGLSAVLFSTPYITGPPGFTGQPDPITGQQTTVISGSGPQLTCAQTTLGCAGGAFGYGFAPDNTVPGQQAPSFAGYSQPVVVGNQSLLQSISYYGGPPAFPKFNDGTYPAGFLGFSPGFVSFQPPAVAGTYKLDVVIPTGPTTSGTISTSANLTSTVGLAAIAPPSAFPDPANPGGLKIDLVVPAGVTETWVFVQDSGGCYPHSQGNSMNVQYYTVRTTQTGAQQLTVPPNLGPTDGSGSTPTICSALQNQQATGNPNAPGDTYTVFVAGFDYPAYGAAYPFNQQQTPAFTGPGGQVDVTLTQPVNFVYP
jgi:hypothetical protein